MGNYIEIMADNLYGDVEDVLKRWQKELGHSQKALREFVLYVPRKVYNELKQPTHIMGVEVRVDPSLKGCLIVLGDCPNKPPKTATLKRERPRQARPNKVAKFIDFYVKYEQQEFIETYDADKPTMDRLRLSLDLDKGGSPYILYALETTHSGLTEQGIACDYWQTIPGLVPVMSIYEEEYIEEGSVYLTKKCV